MGRIIGKALREQAEAMGDVMGDRISNRVIREMDEVLEEREEREEARYKKLDETIRNHQKARAGDRGDQGRRRTKEKPFLPEKQEKDLNQVISCGNSGKTDAGFL